MIHVAHVIFLWDCAASEPHCRVQIPTLLRSSRGNSVSLPPTPPISSFVKWCRSSCLTWSLRRLNELVFVKCSLDGNSPWVFCVSAHLVSRSTECLSSELFFQGCWYSKQPWKTEVASPSNAKVRQVCLLSIIKDWASWPQSSSFVPHPPHVQASPGPFFGNWGSEN